MCQVSVVIVYLAFEGDSAFVAALNLMLPTFHILFSVFLYKFLRSIMSAQLYAIKFDRALRNQDHLWLQQLLQEALAE